jgi:hypothetical protein
MRLERKEVALSYLKNKSDIAIIPHDNGKTIRSQKEYLL